MISSLAYFHVIDFIFNKVIEKISIGVLKELSMQKIAFGAC